MKKYSILTLSLAIACTVSFAQNAPATATNTGKHTEPTINGKPYSQWVAEEKAKQQQQEAKAAVENNMMKAPTLPASTAKTAWDTKPVDVNKPVAKENVQLPQIAVNPVDLGTGKATSIDVPANKTVNSSNVVTSPVTATTAKTEFVPQLKTQPGQGNGNTNQLSTPRTADEIAPSVKPVVVKNPVEPTQGEKAKTKE